MKRQASGHVVVTVKPSCTSIREGSFLFHKVKFSFYSRNDPLNRPLSSKERLDLAPFAVGCSAHQRGDPPVRQPHP